MRFKDRVVMITGGGGKIGKAYALGFAKEGAKVCLPDLVDATPVVKAIQDQGGTAMAVQCDVSNEASVKAMVDVAVKEFGFIDILINNAAYFMTVKKSPFWEWRWTSLIKPWLSISAVSGCVPKRSSVT